MTSKIISLILILSLFSISISTVTGCAGGSRGTGVRFNSGSGTLLGDDEDDDDDRPPRHR